MTFSSVLFNLECWSNFNVLNRTSKLDIMMDERTVTAPNSIIIIIIIFFKLHLFIQYTSREKVICI